MRNTIGFKHLLIKEEHLTYEEVFVMTAISLVAESTEREGVYYVNYEDAMYFAFGKKFSYNDSMRFHFGLSSLENRGFFSVEEKINSHIVIAKVPFIVTPCEHHFVVIKRSDINRIFLSDIPNPKMLLTFYIQLMAMRDGSRQLDKEFRFKIVHMAKSFISKSTELNIKTVREYIKQLSSLKLIVVACPKRSCNDKERHVTCLYSSYEDIDALTSYINKYHSGKYYAPGTYFNDEYETLSYEEKANRYRGYLSKYRWLKEGKTYSREEVYQIKKACEEYNRKQLAKQKENLEKDMDFYPKLKDMSVFDDYDFSDLEKMDQFKIPGVNPFA